MEVCSNGVGHQGEYFKIFGEQSNYITHAVRVTSWRYYFCHSHLKEVQEISWRITSLLTNILHKVHQYVVNWNSFSFYQIKASVPHGLVLTTSLFLLNINDQLASTFNPIYSYVGDITLYTNFQRPNPLFYRDRDQQPRDWD